VFLRELAAAIEGGMAPLLEMGGTSAETASKLRAVANDMYSGRTVGYACRHKLDQDVLAGWLGDLGRPKLEEGDVLRFMVGKPELQRYDLGLNVGWVPVERLKWLAQVVGANMHDAYEAGRGDMRREARKAAEGVIELLGLKSWK
jgi:hypothetical protein